jgi:hypothetical protein
MPEAGSNLQVTMKINNTHRAAVARAWRDARAHGEDQATFCARQVPPIRPRTLRQWVKTFDSGPAPGSDLHLINAALANLRVLADLLEWTRLGRSPPRSRGDAGLASSEAHPAGDEDPGTMPDRHGGIGAPGEAEDDLRPGEKFWDAP